MPATASEHQIADPDQQAKQFRDPVAPAERSKAALAKTISHIFPDDTAVHSFCTLMAEHAIIVRNAC